jgi:hypothetical protein
MFAKIGRWPGRSEAENERVSCITRIVGKVWIGAGRSKAGIPSGLRKQLSTLQEAAASSALICGARDKNGPSFSGGEQAGAAGWCRRGPARVFRRTTNQNRSRQIVIIFGSDVWNQNPMYIFKHFAGTIPALRRLYAGGK